MSERHVVPELQDCFAFAEVHLESQEDAEQWQKTRHTCAVVLSQRAIYVMRLFREGDCDALLAFAETKARREEARLVAYLLDHLGDERARALFAKVQPLDQNDPLDQFEALRGVSQFLAPEEGCHPALCRAGTEAACSPWFGLSAPGACVPLRFGSAEGCMPAYCMEAHEFLTLAARRNWDRARSMLLAELAEADGYVWGSLCHCGIRSDIADRQTWTSLVSNEEELEALLECFSDVEGNTTASCRQVTDKASDRSCGQVAIRRSQLSGLGESNEATE